MPRHCRRLLTRRRTFQNAAPIAPALPRHGKPKADSERSALALQESTSERAQQQVEVDEAGISRFWRVDRDGVLLFERHAAVRSNEFNEPAPRHTVNRFFQIEQADEALFSLILLPVIEPIDAMEAGENPVLPGMILRPVLSQDEAA